MSDIKNQKINSFLNDLGSNSPTPGGGAAAALVGAMASSLVEMVANLTTNKKRYENVSDLMAGIAKDAKGHRKRLLSLSEQDIRAFNQVMSAYKTKTNIQASLKKATEVPLETAEVSHKVLELANQVINKGNKNALSDAKSAKYLAQAAISSALENVQINIGFIDDSKFTNKVKKSVAALN